jgi:hypothetical protein
VHRRRLPLVLCALAAAGAAPAGAGEKAEITLSRGGEAVPFPTEGEAVTITVIARDGAETEPLADRKVVALYRPNSAVSEKETIGLTDAQGRLAWTPSAPGVVRLAVWGDAEGKVIDGERLVSVRFASLPLLGIAIMIGAGCILFGGVIASWVVLQSGDAPEEEPGAAPEEA